ncbi:GNAT family N-acetyltransferase [Homoserinibacter sp. YIM 151385]|uniref:GNAT family N-acetyltransferase n=1 Tax=Homoserinibacter sp. YIM 151385 TaxID=2985506 RepID=UPI0022F03C13|nr:GNAT family N-acetyltransferase [Homoserinibacter sp. YIM 151385]WBU39103.1 GNAT family N-acetyltransferase [Homoserinibacter sp. YIM 151385]
MHEQGWRLTPARPDDAGWMAELRAQVMRPDLERLGRYDETRVRRRFLGAYRPEGTRVVELDGERIGLIGVRPEVDATWIEHFYLPARVQGAGIGSAILASVLAEPGRGLPHRLQVLVGSRARRLYERAGFRPLGDDGVDLEMIRDAPGAASGLG